MYDEMLGMEQYGNPYYQYYGNPGGWVEMEQFFGGGKKKRHSTFQVECLSFPLTIFFK